MYNIFVLTTVHDRNDTRVFRKECVSLSNIDNVKLTAVVTDGLGDEIRNEYFVRDLGKAPGGRLGRIFMSPLKVLLFVLKNRPDVVHFHDPELIPICVALSFLGVKVIYDVHEDVPEDIRDKFWIPKPLRPTVSFLMNVVEVLSAKCFDAIIVATPSISRRFPCDKTYLVQNFPSLREFAFTKKESSPPSNKFVYLGAITRIRGLSQVVEALELIPKEYNAYLEVGGGISPNTYQLELQKMRGWSQVLYRGMVPRYKLEEFFDGGVAGIVTFLPAHNHINAQPNKLFEYMAAGLPVIASDFPLWKKIIDDASCGLLVDSGSPESIRDAMQYMLDNPGEVEEMGRAGHNAVLNIYNWECEEKKLKECYFSLLKS